MTFRWHSDHSGLRSHVPHKIFQQKVLWYLHHSALRPLQADGEFVVYMSKTFMCSSRKIMGEAYNPICMKGLVSKVDGCTRAPNLASGPRIPSKTEQSSFLLLCQLHMRPTISSMSTIWPNNALVFHEQCWCCRSIVLRGRETRGRRSSKTGWSTSTLTVSGRGCVFVVVVKDWKAGKASFLLFGYYHFFA